MNKTISYRVIPSIGSKCRAVINGVGSRGREAGVSIGRLHLRHCREQKHSAAEKEWKLVHRGTVFMPVTPPKRRARTLGENTPQFPLSAAKISLANLFVLAKRGRFVLEQNAPCLEHVTTMRDLQRQICVLLDEQNREAQLPVDLHDL